MNVSEAVVNRDFSDEAGTSLHGRQLVLARVVWTTLILITLGIFVVCLPIYFSILQTICTNATSAACADKQLTPDAAQTLQHLGISLSLYAAANLALLLIWACTWFVVGALIAWRKSNDWVALLVAFWLVLQGTTNATLTVGNSQSGWQWPALLFNNLAFLFLYLVFFLFPDGRFVPRWMRWVMLALVAESVLSFLFPDLAFLSIFSSFGGTIIIIIAQIYRYRRVSTALQRQQTKWVVYGLTVTLVCDLIVALPVFFFPSAGTTLFAFFYNIFFETAITFFTFLIPIAFGVAILRHRLWDIDIIINRTLVYGTLTAILALLYFGLIFALQYLLQGIINNNNDVAIVVSTLAIAALFQPLRHRIQRVIDRRFYRRKYDAARTVEAFSAILRNEVDLSQLSEYLVAVVQETMQPAHISLWLRKTDHESKRHSNL